MGSLTDNKSKSTIFTVTANCQDCYRCVWFCPVKAIKVTSGQARIEEDLCIKCGTCVRECPQHAKTIYSSLTEVKELLASGKPVAASIAPSFAALFNGWKAHRLPSALRKLGFSYVAETAEGASYVTEKAFSGNLDGNICSACPAVVGYIEKYKPELIDHLIPITSPMVAHGRLLKKRYPGCAVVFIGPCAAKKDEAMRAENADALDAVLTFAELLDWLSEEEIDLANLTESGFDLCGDIGQSRLFPLQGGMLKAGAIGCDVDDLKAVHVSGAEEVMELLDSEKSLQKYQVVEPLFCKNGCINGPAFPAETGLFERRDDLIAYAKGSFLVNPMQAKEEVSTDVVFQEEDLLRGEVTDSQINKVFERTGKTDEQFRLNCGACGYKSCVDNAIAVVRGMAEPEMCIPYMRRLAQQRTDRIIETSPDGVVLLDSELCIISMNPAFQKMFFCNNGLLGHRISYLVNAEGFENIMSGSVEQYESIQSKYGIKYHEILYALREEHQYVGIYSDISKVKFDHNQLDVIKQQTLLHAREFLDYQIKFSQEMAHFLGKSTAQSEEIAKRLISLYEDPKHSGDGE